jgi:hypothetical protein
MLIEVTSKIDETKFSIRAETIYHLKADRDGTRIRTDDKPEGYHVSEQYSDLKKLLNVTTVQVSENAAPAVQSGTV